MATSLPPLLLQVGFILIKLLINCCLAITTPWDFGRQKARRLID
jgi:hypothetical protein